MAGGLIVLGFLFLTFLFRSTIVGDVGARDRPTISPPRSLPAPAPDAQPRRADGRGFQDGRALGRAAPLGIDEALHHLESAGLGPLRLIAGRAACTRVRVYACACQASPDEPCGFERGAVLGVFERLTGESARAEEVACRQAGAPHCDFDVRHALRGGVR